MGAGATRTSCSPKLIRPLTGAADCSDLLQSRRPESMSGSGYLKFRNDRGIPEIRIGVREFECIGGVPTAGPPARLHQYGRGRHDPLSLLRDAVPLRFSINTARCRAAGQFISRSKRGLSGAAQALLAPREGSADFPEDDCSAPARRGRRFDGPAQCRRRDWQHARFPRGSRGRRHGIRN